jgi:GTPase
MTPPALLRRRRATHNAATASSTTAMISTTIQGSTGALLLRAAIEPCSAHATAVPEPPGRYPAPVSQFVDECGLHVKGGDGGAGSVSFRREAHVARGGPDGGDGGSGGDVWLVADRNIASLVAFKDHPHRRATKGVHGMGKKRHGARGTDLMVPVPEGTVVRDQDGTVLADLVHAGDRWLAAEGGRGGRGNARFLSNRRRAPSFAEQGEVGEERWLRLELKLMADAALVGFPNVGKSTLISRISAAKPKIADYPFTTLEPNLGVVRTDDGTEMVVADVPGLIEGASEGRGLGDRFLRHVERARVLVLLIDLAPMAERPPAEQAEVLLRELGDYEPDLLERERIVVGSRADLAEPGLRFDGPRVSAVTGDGIPRLVGAMVGAVQRARAELPEPEAFVVHRPVAEGYRVERDVDGGWVVVGRQAERAVALSDLTNPEALDEAHRRLRALGVDRALARAGVGPGDEVRIGRLSFDYEEDVIQR